MAMVKEVCVDAIVSQSPLQVRASFGARPRSVLHEELFSHSKAQLAELCC